LRHKKSLAAGKQLVNYVKGQFKKVAYQASCLKASAQRLKNGQKRFMRKQPIYSVCLNAVIPIKTSFLHTGAIQACWIALRNQQIIEWVGRTGSQAHGRFGYSCRP
jgi:hypothetical protein